VLVRIAHRLVPDAAKEGYEDGAASTNENNENGASSSAAAAAPRVTPRPMPGPRPTPIMDDGNNNDPLRIGPIRGPPRMPHQPFPGGMMPGMPGMPGGFGSDDLVPGGGVGPPMWGPRGGAMGGNLMGPRNFPGMGGGRGMGGMGGMAGIPGLGRGRGRGLPGRVPPGARYDPMGPGGVGPDNDIERPPPEDDDPPAGMYW